ncbi:MAG: hypothetical protein ACKOWD_11445 [Rhodoferax sp.]
MHLPPAAQVTVGRSKVCFTFVLGWAWAYACLLLALSEALAPGAWTVLALGCLATCALAAWSWWKSPAGVLVWSGRRWAWQTADEHQACELDWRVDFQSLVLVLLTTQAGARRWLWVERDDQNAAAWPPFRRALVASRLHVDGGGGDDAGIPPGYLSS